LDSYKLTRDPGQSFEYSNLGIGLLGDALANRAHMSYDRLLQTRVLDPLGMAETAITLSTAERARFAAGHDDDDNPVAPWNFEALAPAGALRSTAADIIKYVQCNMGQGPLAKACLFAQEPRSTFPGNHIGLVWWTGDVEAIIHHGGDTAGYHASVAISPDHASGAVVLTNGGDSVDGIAVHMIDPMLPVASTSFPPVAPLTRATLDSYVGMYVNKDAGLTFAIRHVGDAMTVQLTGQPQVHIYPSAMDAFYLRVVDAHIAFSRDADGNVSGFVLHQNGHDILAVRTSAVATTPTTAPSPSAAPTPSPAPSGVAPVNLDDYVGTFDSDQGLSFVVTRSGDQLIVQLTGQPAVPVYESAKDKFYYKVVDAQIDFVRDANGKVTQLVLHQNGNTIAAARSSVGVPQPSFPPVVTLDSATLESYVGTYIASPSAAFTVMRNGDQIMIQLTGQPAIPIYPSAKDAFYCKVVDAQVTFVRDANGKITQLILHQNGRDIPAVRS
jgi:D-alanyl-D-alanine-carboxypeptidase/D-alanyl-D-alanine-endopeptidase